MPILCLMKRIKGNSCNSVTAAKKMKPQRRAVTSFHDSVSNSRINEEKPPVKRSGFRFVASKKPTLWAFTLQTELYQFCSILMVRVTGLEPAHRKTLDPKSSASANSATPAYIRDDIVNITYSTQNCAKSQAFRAKNH